MGERTNATLLHADYAIRLSPRDPLLVIWYLCQGWAALTADRYEEAVEFAIRAAESNFDFPDIYAVRAAAEGQLGRVDAGRSTLDKLLRRTRLDRRRRAPQPAVRPRGRSRALPYRFAQGRSARRMKSWSANFATTAAVSGPICVRMRTSALGTRRQSPHRAGSSDVRGQAAPHRATVSSAHDP